jgi:hypothetical protein
MKHFISLLFCLCIISNNKAQSLFHKTYDWEPNPKLYVPEEKDKKNDLIIVLQHKTLETAYEPDGKAVVYETVHYIYHLNSASVVENFNKGFVPIASVIDEVSLNARCIQANGKVILFNPSSIKRVDNYENSGAYKIFAIEGVEQGCDVEIMYTNKRPFSYGSYYLAQNASPTKRYETHIISPENLIFEAKSYNGLPTFQKDTSDKTRNHLFVTDNNVPASEDERYANEEPNKRAFAYQLYYNTSNSKAKLYTWDIISREYYTSLFTFEKDELKAVAKVLSKNKIESAATAEEKVRKLDVFFKTSCEINDDYDLKFTAALDNRKMNYHNGMRFYVAALKHMEIPFELGLTTRRDELHFDSKFPSYMYTKVYILYFPGMNKYLSPLSIYSRLGMPEPDVMNNEGLFIKEVNLGDIKSSTAKIKMIPPNDFKQSFHETNVIAEVNFADNTVKLDVTQMQQGYATYYVQPVYRYYTAEQKEEQNKNAYILSGMVGQNFEVSNTTEDELFVKPYTIKYKAEQNDLIENAGKKYLFKVGALIGPQVELYSEQARQWPADVYNTHFLKRTLEINVPAGFKVTNLSELNFEKICMVNGKEGAVFRSSASIAGTKITVNVYEDYQVIEYPLDSYEQFRAVINASADFNKKNLVFEQQ